MAILEKEVWVIINGANLNFLESLGYEIPRLKTKRGKMSIPRGSGVLVKIEHLTKGSHTEVTRICDDCGKHSPNIKFADILKRRMTGDGKDRCFECGNIKSGKTQQNVEYKRTLEFCAKRDGREYLLEEFSEKNDRKVYEVAYQSNISYIWDCLKCGSEYLMKVNNRTSNKNNNGCPYCSSQKVNHTNCLATTNPEILKYLTNPKIAYEVTSGTGEYTNFTCPDCNYEDNKSIKNIVQHGFSCPRCSDGISYPEKFITEMLNQIGLNFKPQRIFEWSLNKRYDFYLQESNLIIEAHGEQHYKESFGLSKGRGRTLIEEKENDELKEKLARENGINDYIVIDCRESELEFIKDSILKSKLSRHLTLEEIDWLKCHEYACNSLVKVVCDLWNKNQIGTVQIGENLGIDRSTVNRYLKQGKILGWCEYNPEDVRKKNIERAIASTRKQIVQLTKENEFIKLWVSLAEASRVLNIQSSGIGMACKGKINQSGGFKWMYKEDYDKKIN